ncbi:hypothetical protein [Halobacillus aidingensis]|uniref:Uncharacterized protein n=1 Tax=Halobacillus aidingensis TaxID=240303 RepID=A0A1H0LTV3_HALAD|nr:hypothetical protein [Halobacillus aidingensis]SDO71594.1 hypothetical protein SAMN05421677_107123 [Halobacillus aidingensis]
MEMTYGFKANEKGEQLFVILLSGINESNFVKISNFEYHLLARKQEIKVLCKFRNDFAYFIRNGNNERENEEHREGNTAMTRFKDGTYRLFLRVELGKKKSFRLKRSSFIAEVIFKEDQEYIQKKEMKNRKLKRTKVGHSSNNRSKERNSGESLKKMKKKAGVYQAYRESRACMNCIHLIGNKCVMHQLNVNRTESCRKFRAYKIQYGGGFSPR